MPKEYFGNAIFLVTLTATAADLVKKGIGWVALQINKKVTNQNNEEVKKWYENWIEKPEVVKKEGKLERNGIGVSSSPRFNMYGNDFGWGKPVAIRSGISHKYKPMFTFFAGADDGDMDIEACLFPETLIAMGNDEEFMEFVACE